MSNGAPAEASTSQPLSDGVMIAGLVMGFVLPIGGLVVAAVLLARGAWRAALPLAGLSCLMGLVWWSLLAN